MSIHFESKVHEIRERLIVRLPDEASAELPSRGQVSVTGRINGHTFDTVLEPDGIRGHWLPLEKKMAQSLSVHDGDAIKLEIEVTKEIVP